MTTREYQEMHNDGYPEDQKFECGDCGCYFWVEDRNEFECPNCLSKQGETNDHIQR